MLGYIGGRSRLATVFISGALALGACGSDESHKPGGDADGDGISNADEGFEDDVNTDGDEWPDWLDLDSDGDGIPDADEAGDDDLETPPIDTDGDGVPDFQDTDSDGDGILDSEGVGEDGELIDTDGDGEPDFIDLDDDGDGIPDDLELVLGEDTDTDGDGVVDRLDDDSDGDGIPDSIEGSVDTDGDFIPDFRDLDSDGDGLPDADEDLNGNGKVDDCGSPIMPPCESDRIKKDTDGDGVPDLIERVAGTDPTDKNSTIPDSDFYFVLPYEDPSQEGVLEFSTTIRQADVFFSVDTTGSFGEEIEAIQNTINSLIVPEVGKVIDNPAFGVGRFEDFPIEPHGLPSDLPYELLQPITTDAALIQSGIDALPPAAGGLNTPEAGMEALYQWATGVGIPSAGLPAFAPGDIGGAGFRSDSLPIIVQITDAISHVPADYAGAGISTHDSAATIKALNLIGARVIGVRSIENDGTADDPRAELEQLALGTRATIPPDADGQCATGIDGADQPAVDQGGTDVCPLVFDVRTDGTGLGEIIVDAIRQLATLANLDISAIPIGESQGVAGEVLPAGTDTADFIQSITPEAPAPPGSTIDGDVFRKVKPGSTVHFKLTARNDFVRHISVPQLFTIDIHVLGDEVTVLDVRKVYVVVPPAIEVVVVE